MDRQLINAVRLNDLDSTRELLFRGADVNFRAPDTNETPLIIAVKNNNTQLAFELLKQNGIQPGELDMKGKTALSYAVKNHNNKMVNKLLNHPMGALAYPDNDSAMRNAIEDNNVNVILVLLASGASLFLLVDYIGLQLSPELWATILNHGYSFDAFIVAVNNDKNLLENTLRAGFNPNTQDKHGYKIAHYFHKISREYVPYFFQVLKFYGLEFDPNDRVELEVAYNTPEYPAPRYPLTHRPISPMKFRKDKCSHGNYLPVVRYENLYYGAGETRARFCGTFYYYEPDSVVYLNLGRYLVAGNKYHAFELLIVEAQSIGLHMNIVYKQIDIDDDIIFSEIERIDHLLTKTHNDTELDNFTNWLATIVETKDDDLDCIESFYGLINQFYETIDNAYVGKNVFGEFDFYDQALCQFGKILEYDAIILQREPGQGRAVTEILDVRSRGESYENLCHYPVAFTSIRTNIDINHPTIWFPNLTPLVI